MNVSAQQKLQHLAWRAGFGPDFNWVKANINKPLKEVVQAYISKPSNPKPLSGVPEEYFPDENDKSNESYKSVSKGDIRRLIVKLNLAWMDRLSNTDQPFLERMTLFWHGHFATRVKNPLLLQIQNNTIRQFALGKFGDLVKAIAKDPAMMQFLGTRISRKEKPNENFARELMELFTIGRGNYTEQDIKEAARCFTGWSWDYKYTFRFLPKRFDSGIKTFMGKKGAFSGEDIIDIILNRNETAIFITTKIYKYFVNENINADRIQQLANDFYKSDYDIAKLMAAIFNADWFYEAENVGNKIKSPTTLIAGLNRTFKVQYNNDNLLVPIQRLLGQTLFMPPSVKGWDEGTAWIDTSSLLLRLQLPSVLLDKTAIQLTTKNDNPEELSQMSTQIDSTASNTVFPIVVNWTKVLQEITDSGKLDINSFLIQSPISDHLSNIVGKQVNKAQIINLCSTPEYQLC